MRKHISRYLIVLSGITALSCEQILNIDRANLFDTGGLAQLDDRSATIVGLIISLETEEPITQHGHCWATHENPTVNDHVSKLGKATQTGDFSTIIDSLEPNNEYFVRAYIETNGNIRYERTISFATRKDQNLPSLITRAVFNVNNTSAEIRSEFLNLGKYEITRYGHCWSESTNTEPDLKDSDIQFSDAGTSPSLGVFRSTINGLQANKTYYIRSFALSRDTTGTEYESYGNIQVFQTAQ
ncbi:MAG: hypothetical protein NW226_00170 [Microscillaceae bacterium]|nr:hypothetical protein [Microscillaceae bacterium]